jgi:hypothetical protein
MSRDRIARLKVTLDDVKPQVLRRLEVPLTIRLDRLHLVLQAALGWTNSHLYELRAQDVGWGVPDPDFRDGPLDARKARLIDVLEDLGSKTLHYLYDFGGGWEHTIKIERIDQAIPGALYPRLLDASGRCPPEDVGGPWGYRSSSPPTPTPSISATPSSLSGWNPAHSILLMSTPRRSTARSKRSPSDGRENLPPSANLETDPPPLGGLSVLRMPCRANGDFSMGACAVPLM